MGGLRLHSHQNMFYFANHVLCAFVCWLVVCRLCEGKTSYNLWKAINSYNAVIKIKTLCPALTKLEVYNSCYIVCQQFALINI